MTTTTLNNLNLKKGNKVFLFNNWNGYQESTIDFYIQEYTIYSIGKKRCYLIYGDDINSRKEYSCTNNINAALTLDEAIKKCEEFKNEFINKQINDYQWRMINWSGYTKTAEKVLNNLMTAKQNIIINPFLK